jgi:hypothetical protein
MKLLIGTSLASALAIGLYTSVESQSRAVTGTVVSAATGAAVRGAVVNALEADSRGATMQTALTDVAGRFLIPLRGMARPTLMARAEGHAFKVISWLPNEPLRISLERAGVVTGVVYETRGNPARDITVSVAYSRTALERPPLAQVHGGMPHVYERGVYRLTGVKPETPLIIQGMRKGVVVGESLPVTVKPGGIVSADIVVSPTVTFRGLVLDERNRPIAGARIRLWVHRPTDSLFHTTRSRMISGHSGTDGSFSFEVVPEGKATVQTTKDGFGQSRQTVALAGIPATSNVTSILKQIQ